MQHVEAEYSCMETESYPKKFTQFVSILKLPSVPLGGLDLV